MGYLANFFVRYVKGQYTVTAAEFACTVSFIIGLLALIGQLTNRHILANWRDPMPMAIPTTVCVMLLSTSSWLLTVKCRYLLSLYRQGLPGIRSFPTAQLEPGATKVFLKLSSVDVIAMLTILITGVGVVAYGRTELTAVLITVVGYYFGRITRAFSPTDTTNGES